MEGVRDRCGHGRGQTRRMLLFGHGERRAQRGQGAPREGGHRALLGFGGQPTSRGSRRRRSLALSLMG